MRLRAEEKGFYRARSHYSVRLRLQRGRDRHLEQSQGRRVTGMGASWDDWREQTKHTRVLTIADTRAHTHTPSVIKKT